MNFTRADRTDIRNPLLYQLMTYGDGNPAFVIFHELEYGVDDIWYLEIAVTLADEMAD